MKMNRLGGSVPLFQRCTMAQANASHGAALGGAGTSAEKRGGKGAGGKEKQQQAVPKGGKLTER